MFGLLDFTWRKDRLNMQEDFFLIFAESYYNYASSMSFTVYFLILILQILFFIQMPACLYYTLAQVN